MTGGQSPERRRLLDRQRQRHKRERERVGQAFVGFYTNEEDLVQLLLGSRYMPRNPNNEYSREALNAAVKRLIESMVVADIKWGG